MEVLVLVLLVGVVLASAVRYRLIRRELRSRVAWQVLPSDEFAPRTEHVLAFARQLVEARLAIVAALLKPAAAYRVRLTSVGDGQMQYEVSAPRGGSAVVERGMFSRVELRRVGDTEVDPESADVQLDMETEAEAGEAVRLERETGAELVVFEGGER